MKLKLTFCELHTPLFMAGKNFGTKLDPTKLPGLTLTYDRSEKEVIVEYNRQVGIVPTSNVAVAVLDPKIGKAVANAD